MKIKRIRKFCLWIIGLISVVIIIKVTIYYNDIAFVRDSVQNAINIELPGFEIIQQNNAGSIIEDNYHYQLKFDKSINCLFDDLIKHELYTHEVLKYRASVRPNVTLWTQKYDYSMSASDSENPQRWVRIMINSNSDTATVQIINM